MIQLPIAKGLAVQIPSSKIVNAFFLPHDADAGETSADDCFITTSTTLDVGEKASGESGLWPAAAFRQQFRFLPATK